ncbi:MAG: hypothetical protein LQ342_006440 [Letrouitia transgressa]|nr:MAG: hypothetical protein LQ342_006440 [Letrouitia transgressa]
MPRIYSRLILIFPTLDASVATQHVRSSLSYTLELIPFLTGSVVPSLRGGGRVDVFNSDEHSAPLDTLFEVQDLTAGKQGSKLSLQDLREKNFPIELLDSNLLAPVPALPSQGKPVRVFMARANVLEDGLLLCVAFHHSVMDVGGIAAVLKVWSGYCHAMQIPGDEGRLAHMKNVSSLLSTGSLDRFSCMTGREGLGGEGEVFREYKIPDSSTAPTTAQLPQMGTAILRFEEDKLKALKEKVMSRITEEGVEQWVSTNDCLSAVVWYLVTAARYSGGTLSNEKESMLGFAINGRKKIDPPLPETYVSNVNLYGTSVMQVSEMLDPEPDATLVKIALSIRDAVRAVDSRRIRAVISFLDSQPDISVLVPGFKSFLGPDFALTSWADTAIGELDWGRSLVEKVEKIRIPSASFDGLGIVPPRTGDGGLEVLVGLKKDDLERIKGSDRLGTWGCNFHGM